MGTGLKIMAGQWTMSGLIVDLTGQTLVLPVIFGCEHFIIFSIQLLLNAFCSITLFVQAKKYLARHHDRRPAVRYFEPWGKKPNGKELDEQKRN